MLPMMPDDGRTIFFGTESNTTNLNDDDDGGDAYDHDSLLKRSIPNDPHCLHPFVKVWQLY